MESALLVMAHPGHELAIHEFVRRHRPTVCVITDGSGGAGIPRLARSWAHLEAAGCARGPLFGLGSDAALYAQILAADVDRFRAWARTLADEIVASRPALVVADPLEGFNPVHDLCRYLVDSACHDARERGWAGANLTYALDGPPHARPPACGKAAITIELDRAALEQKLAVARGYAELRAEVDAALEAHGREVFAKEHLFEADGRSHTWDWADEAPAYERYGRERLDAGRYERLITWRSHVQPIAEALARPLVPAL